MDNETKFAYLMVSLLCIGIVCFTAGIHIYAGTGPALIAFGVIMILTFAFGVAK